MGTLGGGGCRWSFSTISAAPRRLGKQLWFSLQDSYLTNNTQIQTQPHTRYCEGNKLSENQHTDLSCNLRTPSLNETEQHSSTTIRLEPKCSPLPLQAQTVFTDGSGKTGKAAIVRKQNDKYDKWCSEGLLVFPQIPKCDGFQHAVSNLLCHLQHPDDDDRRGVHGAARTQRLSHLSKCHGSRYHLPVYSNSYRPISDLFSEPFHRCRQIRGITVDC
ncbi:PREDICTED: uncharacterized protein LOC108494011 [Lepidothrix coronata]|uniref:Uncharacterized protein LOC108494011 n=1 Tax=Lepidothrix coronata TaxID=321398 RepID=A0A6J0GP04_9PASS|nr:PREDICTED: uncharacterized protein LOC108494011 [Lepidothrix coronata]